LSKSHKQKICRRLSLRAAEKDRLWQKKTLVIASKVKAYVKETSDLRCSASVIELLSEKIRHQLDEAIKKAKADSRKTLLDKDF
jgi:hypothetical protein